MAQINRNNAKFVNLGPLPIDEKDPPKSVVWSLLFGVFLMAFVISLAVVVALNCTPLYAWDIDRLGLAESSGLSKEMLLENYRILIRYNNLWGPDTLAFPDFAMSDTGRIHFAEVRAIFLAFEIALPISFLLVLVSAFFSRKWEDPRYLKWGGIFTLVLPVLLGIAAAVNFDKLFVAFHRVMFDNDYWIFDETTDPIITVLPEEFFMHEAFLIFAIVAVGALLSLLIYRIRRNRYARR